MGIALASLSLGTQLSQKRVLDAKKSPKSEIIVFGTKAVRAHISLALSSGQKRLMVWLGQFLGQPCHHYWRDLLLLLC